MKAQELRWVIFECGHARKLWFFATEGELIHAMCLGESCPPRAMRRVISASPVHEVGVRCG